jgi:hypothetical protein
MTTDKHKANLMGELKSILLATDGSIYSKSALRQALIFAEACHIQLTLLHILEFSPQFKSHFETIGLAHLREMEEKTRLHYEEIREKAAEDHNVEMNIVIRTGDHPYKRIVEEATARKSDLIIMGKHGKTEIQRLVMGSVTAKVIAYSPCKVLVVSKDASVEGKNIMLATDGSPYSDAAEMEAINMADRCPMLKNFVALSVAPGKDELQHARYNLESVISKAKDKGVKVEAVAMTGEPYKVITEQAKERDIDIIIIGTHGRTGLEKLLMGSVAERVVAVAHCSVLIAKKH